MGHIMYKGQSIDCSYFLGKDSSFANFGIPKEDAPVSSLVPDELIQDGNIRLPILWFNEKYKQKYYISCTKVNDDDIPIGILLHKSSSDTDLNSYKTINGYIFDNKLTFASINYLDANNINGSKQIVRNLSYGDNIKKLSYDYLKGYTHDTKNREEYGIEENVQNSLNESISNTQKLWNFYDTENKDWKTDPEFITYAKSCFLYSTPGTKQGDWKMIDLNFAGYNITNGDAGFFNRSLAYLGTQGMGDNMLTAFTSMGLHWAEEHGGLPEVVGVLSGWNSETWHSIKIDTVDYNDKLAGFAELTLSISNFKFKQGSASGRLNWLGIGSFSLKVEGYSRFNMEVVQYTKVLWNNDYSGCGKITGELIDADSGQKLYDFGVLGPNINFWRREGNYKIYMGSRKLVFDLDVNKKYIIKLTGVQTLDSHYMANSGENYIITDAGYWVSK